MCDSMHISSFDVMLRVSTVSDLMQYINNTRSVSYHGSVRVQLLLRSETRYFAKGSIIADSRGDANGLLVVTSGQVSLCLRLLELLLYMMDENQIHISLVVFCVLIS